MNTKKAAKGEKGAETKQIQQVAFCGFLLMKAAIV